MFHCDPSFKQHTDTIRAVWEWRSYLPIEKWWWWLAVPLLWGFILGIMLLGLDDSTLSPFTYLRQAYCPRVGDCVMLLPHWPLPAWYLLYVTMAFLFLVFGLTAYWAYRHSRWCLAWWAYVAYVFSFLWWVGGIGGILILAGVSDSPIPTALVGYGLPVIYTLWFFGSLLPSVRPLWRGKRTGFRPPPLKLRAGAASTAALLGILGVALGRMFGEMPHGNWGYLIMGSIGTPWLLQLTIRPSVEELVTLSPWWIVLESEAGVDVEALAPIVVGVDTGEEVEKEKKQ